MIRISEKAALVCGFCLSLASAGCGTGSDEQEAIGEHGWEQPPEAAQEVGLTDHELAVKAELDREIGGSNAVTIGVPDGSVHREVVDLGTLGCTGEVISERYIVTAGHCVDSQIGFPGAQEGSLSLTVYYSSNGTTKTLVYSGSARAAVMPEYISAFIFPCSYPQYDIALIKLNSDMSTYFRTRLHLIPFAMLDSQEISGWGKHNGGSGGVSRAMGFASVDSFGGDGYIRLNGLSHGDSGDSGGGYFIRPSSDSSTRVMTGVHSCHGGAESEGPLISMRRTWLHDRATAWGRPFTCNSTTLAGIPYEYACTD